MGANESHEEKSDDEKYDETELKPIMESLEVKWNVAIHELEELLKIIYGHRIGVNVSRSVSAPVCIAAAVTGIACPPALIPMIIVGAVGGVVGVGADIGDAVRTHEFKGKVKKILEKSDRVLFAFHRACRGTNIDPWMRHLMGGPSQKGLAEASCHSTTKAVASTVWEGQRVGRETASAVLRTAKTAETIAVDVAEAAPRGFLAFSKTAAIPLVAVGGVLALADVAWSWATPHSSAKNIEEILLTIKRGLVGLEIIKSLPTFSEGPKASPALRLVVDKLIGLRPLTRCPVCWEDMKKKGGSIVIGPCGHSICRTCRGKIEPKCPVCRGGIWKCRTPNWSIDNLCEHLSAK